MRPSHCSRSSTPTTRCTGRTTPTRSARTPAATSSSARPGRSRSTCSRPMARRRGDHARGRNDRLVGHLDDVRRGRAPELHAHVDGPHDVARGELAGDRLVRRGGDQPGGMRGCRGPLARPLRGAARRRRGLLGEHLVLEHAAGGLRRRRRRHDLRDAGRLGRGLDDAARRLINGPASLTLCQHAPRGSVPGEHPSHPRDLCVT